jgi:RecA-family ATPase
MTNQYLDEIDIEAAFENLIEQHEKMETAAQPDNNVFNNLKDLEQLGWLTEKPQARKYVFMSEEKDGSKSGFMPASKVCMIVSPGGCGKTFLLTHCALAAATGTNWLHTTASDPMKVLFIAAEEDKNELWLRFHNMAKSLGFQNRPNLMKLALKNIIPIADQGVSMRLINDKNEATETYNKLKALIEADKDIKLIILDPASQFMGCETETNNAAATDFVRLIGALNLIGGKPTVLISHHTNKSALNPTSNDKLPAFSQSFSRGSSALVDGARWLMGMQRSEMKDSQKSIFIKVLKSNYTKLGEILEFQQDYANSGILRYIGEASEETMKEKKISKAWQNAEEHRAIAFSSFNPNPGVNHD